MVTLMSAPKSQSRGRPKTGRIRVVLKLTPAGNALLAKTAARNGMSKGEYVERLLQLVS